MDNNMNNNTNTDNNSMNNMNIGNEMEFGNQSNNMDNNQNMQPDMGMQNQNNDMNGNLNMGSAMNFQNQNNNMNNNQNMQPDMGMQNQNNNLNMNGGITPPVNNKNNLRQMKVMDKKTIIIIAVVAVVAVILLIGITSIFGGGTANAEDALPKSSSKYNKVCTGNINSTELEEFSINYAMGIYEESGKVQYDAVIMWSAADKGKTIIIPEDSTENEVVSTFATATALSITMDGTAEGSANNYYKNGRVYITRTFSLDSSQFPTADSYAEELKTINAVCK